jgi:alpha-ketoglutarate-dependent taurine dioxygenase
MNILSNTKEDYKRWKDKKLESFTSNLDHLTVHISNPNSVSKPEKNKVISLIDSNSMAFFNIDNINYRDKLSIKKFAFQIGLSDYELDSQSDDDGLTEITEHEHNNKISEYIPYTTKELNWHTDGYYNTRDNSILSWLLFCNTPSKKGGVNTYLDHEISYILFNESSGKIKDLMLETACCIPENILTKRKEVHNPVYMFDNEKLHMKFSMRKKNIIWNDASLEAINILKSIINDSFEYHVTKKFTEGEGVITNNVIHKRTAFTNSENKNRLLYRLRSKRRVIK